MKLCVACALCISAAYAEPALQGQISECGRDVSPATLATVIQAESAGNHLAIAMVGGSVPQPKTLTDAIATARALQAAGKNFSVGLMQVNVKNFKKYGLTVATAFDTCQNIRTGSAILANCFKAAKGTGQYSDDQHALRAAMSCYYSGNFQRGFKLENTSRGQSSYVSRIDRIVETAYNVPAIKPIRQTDSEPNSQVAAEPVKSSQGWDAFGELS